MSTKTLPLIRINEIFGPTFQGEGQTIGKLSAFVRVSGCNLTCSWCDTPYTWDWKGLNGVVYDPKKETIGFTVEQVVGQILSLNMPKGSHIVFTGGEPMNQQSKLLNCMKQLKKKGYVIEVETNGTVKAKDEELFNVVDYFNVSPKLFNAGMTKEKTIKPIVLKQIMDNAKNYAFKFVVKEKDDLFEVDEIVKENNLNNVYIMPEGKNNKEHFINMVQLADDILERGYNLSPRLHILLWSDKRGK
jgi:7-cyano-7-deazaguanosine (preQ0) biosynthesis protein QueE